MLEDWIFVAQKAEMDAIEEMCMVIKDSIEEETKIQSELRINFMDFTVDQSILNYVTPAPPLHPPREESCPNRFTIPSIMSWIDELHLVNKSSFNKDNKMRVQALYQLWKSRLNSSIRFKGGATLPQIINEMEMEKFMALNRNLDPGCSGFVNYRQMLTYLTLMSSPVPTEKQAAVLKTIADTNGYISKEALMGANLWFDEHEISNDLPQYEVF